MKLYGVTGWKNAGKTTMVERLVTEITGRGFSVSTLKHAHHSTDVDQPGRDSHRHREAGAREVLLASPNRWALMAELREEPEPSMEELAARLSPVDLVLVEGWKSGAHPKIEVWRAALGRPPIASDAGPAGRAIRAVACDAPVMIARDGGDPESLPIDDISAIADFILREVGLTGAGA